MSSICSNCINNISAIAIGTHNEVFNLPSQSLSAYNNVLYSGIRTIKQAESMPQVPNALNSIENVASHITSNIFVPHRSELIFIQLESGYKDIDTGEEEKILIESYHISPRYPVTIYPDSYVSIEVTESTGPVIIDQPFLMSHLARFGKITIDELKMYLMYLLTDPDSPPPPDISMPVVDKVVKKFNLFYIVQHGNILVSPRPIVQEVEFTNDAQCRVQFELPSTGLIFFGALVEQTNN